MTSHSIHESVSYGPDLDPNLPKTLTDALARAARIESKGIWYLNDAGNVDFQSYRDLQRQASLIAGNLKSRGVGRGTRVLIQLANAREIVPAVWGCLSVGAAACLAPVAEHFASQSRTAPSVDWASIADCRFRINEVPSSDDSQATSFQRLAGDEEWMANRSSDDLALILFTSGSTGLPKAVPLRDRNLLGYMFGMSRAHDFGPDDVVVNWLGLDHIGAICMMHLLAIGAGCSQVQTSTRYVLDAMPRWLDVMDTYGVTIGWSPNFAYRVLVEQKETVLSKTRDLSRVRYLINGGEQVQTTTVRLFEEMLAGQGLRPGAVRPCYGMSETCSAIAASDDQSCARRGLHGDIAEVGPPIAGARIRVTGEDGRVVNEGEEGRIELAGPSVFGGYWGVDPRDTLQEGWLLTEDTGFLRDGRLYITGRRKETVIINSRHYPCVEIEDAAAIDSVDRAAVVACGYRASGADTEQLAIFFAPRDRNSNLNDLSQDIRHAVLRRIGRAPDVLISFSPEQVPRSGIGKVLRQRLKAELQRGLWDHAILSSTMNAEMELFEQSWRLVPFESGNSIQAELGTWVLFDDGDHPFAEWARAIEQRRGTVRVLHRQDFGIDGEAGNSQRSLVSVENWKRVLTRIADESAPGFIGLVLSFSGDSISATSEHALRVFLACRAAARALAELNRPSPAMLRVVFRVPIGEPLTTDMVREVARSAVRSVRSDGILSDTTWSVIDESPSTIRRFVNELDSLKTMATQWRRGRRHELEIARIQQPASNEREAELGEQEINVFPQATVIGQFPYSHRQSDDRSDQNQTRFLLCGRIVSVGMGVDEYRVGDRVIAQTTCEFALAGKSYRISKQQIVRTDMVGSPATSMVKYIGDHDHAIDSFTPVLQHDSPARSELNPKLEAHRHRGNDSNRDRLPYHVVSVDQVDEARRFISTGKSVGPVIAESYFESRVSAGTMDRQRGVFLVVGGLGGLGRILCRQLSARGISGLIILGRRPLSADDDLLLDELKRRTELIRYERVDVADRVSMQAFAQQLKRDAIVIDGVYHLAADLSGELQDDDPVAVAQEMKSKMEGAWLLHECSREWPLKEFVLFSSVESLIPARGRAAYSAANAFLDGLARRRCQQGLPGLSICWGAFPDIGLIRRIPMAEATQTNSWMLRSHASGLLQTIDRVYESGTSSAVACTTERQSNLSLPTFVLLNHLTTDGAATSREGSSSAIDLADCRDSTSRREALLLLIDQTLSKVTGWRHFLQPTTTFEEMGVDSIQVVGVLYALGRATGLTLSATLLTECRTAGDIVDVLEKQLQEPKAKSGSESAMN